MNLQTQKATACAAATSALFVLSLLGTGPGVVFHDHTGGARSHVHACPIPSADRHEHDYVLDLLADLEEQSHSHPHHSHSHSRSDSHDRGSGALSELHDHVSPGEGHWHSQNTLQRAALLQSTPPLASLLVRATCHARPRCVDLEPHRPHHARGPPISNRPA